MFDYDRARIAQDYAQHRRVHPGVLEALLRAEGLCASARVLEIGCGSGNYAAALSAAVGCRCIGVDPSIQMARQALAQPGILVGASAGEALPLAPGSFDLAFSVDVIHHVRDRQAFYAEAARVLRPGGLLCTATDSEEIIRAREPLTTYFPETVAADLARYPTLAELQAQMRATGLEVAPEQQVEFAWALRDLAPYRARAYSVLHLIPEAAFTRGLAWMERDLARGPIQAVSRYCILWGRNPP